jgi:hypothetical protein
VLEQFTETICSRAIGLKFNQCPLCGAKRTSTSRAHYLR